jgi:hypothetical protein
MKKIILSSFLLAVIFLFTGCSAKHDIAFNNNYLHKADAKIQVGYITNNTSKTFDVNIEEMLKNSINQKLSQDNLLWLQETNPKLTLNVRILKYSKGNAFARWMMPGLGATVLTIEADLKDGESIVGTARANRTVAAGGAFTVGAWKAVFDDVALDLVNDLKKVR